MSAPTDKYLQELLGDIGPWLAGAKRALGGEWEAPSSVDAHDRQCTWFSPESGLWLNVWFHGNDMTGAISDSGDGVAVFYADSHDILNHGPGFVKAWLEFMGDAE